MKYLSTARFGGVLLAATMTVGGGLAPTPEAQAATSISVQNKSKPGCNIVVGKSESTLNVIRPGDTERATSKSGKNTTIRLAKNDRVKVTQRGTGKFIQEFTAPAYGRYSIATAKDGTKAINVRRVSANTKDRC